MRKPAPAQPFPRHLDRRVGRGAWGTGYAAITVTGKQIKDSSITGRDVKNKSLTKKDFKGSVAGPRGATGAQGAKGDKGDMGGTPPTQLWAVIASDGTKAHGRGVVSSERLGLGHHLHHAYMQATTMTFLGMLAGQIGTAFAARTDRASLRSVGVFSNHLLLWGIAFELCLAALFIYVPVFHELLGTAALTPDMLLFVAPFPFVVWGADELRRWYLRRSRGPAE